jgi:hypothetical protein
MKGKPYKDASAFDAIWGELSGLNVFSEDRIHTLHYWSLKTDDDRQDTMGLLNPQYRSGNCNAWGCLAVDVGTLAGVCPNLSDYAHIDTFVSTDDDGVGQFQIWVKTQGWITSGHNYYNEYRFKPGVDWTPYDGSGHSVPCQGGLPAVKQCFPAHVIIKIRHSGITEYCDPSYGKKAADLLSLENEEIDGTDIMHDSVQLLRRKIDFTNTPFLKKQ